MTVNPPRFSIGRMMVIISLLAADFAILRAVLEGWTALLALIFLPSLNFMLVGLTRLWRGHEGRPYWVGFELAAIASMGLSGLLIWKTPDFYAIPLQWLQDNRSRFPDIPVIWCALIVAIYALPQILAAWFVGRLSARYRIVIERRPRTSNIAEATVEDRGREASLTFPSLTEIPRSAIER